MPVTYTAAMLKGRTVRAFSMLGKPCVGEVCEKCRDEIDYERIIRSRKRKHGEWR